MPALNIGQSVESSDTGGSLIQEQVVNVHFEGGTVVDNAARRLAASVSERVTEETGRHSLWQTEQPIVLHVASTKRPVQARGQARRKLESDSTQIAELFRELPSPQLTIIGAPGAGKTVLALCLTRDLLPELGPKPPQDPIPVFLSLTSWHPDIPLKTWMAARIQEDHPGIADTAAEARELVLKMMAERRIIPVLDGLEEVTAATPADAIAGIGAAFDDRAPFVVTSRGEEYADAVRASGTPLARAAVVEIDDVGVEEAITYLGGAGIDDTRWRPVFERLRADPEGPLAEALSTPLMLSLARIAYQRHTTDPADLLEYTDREDVEEHLIGTFVPATYARHLAPRYAEHQVSRWLGTLARGPLEYRWWYFRSHVPDLVAALIFALGVGWMLQLMMNTTWAVVGAIAVLIVVEVVPLVPRILLRRTTEIVVSENGTADPRAHLRTYRRLALLCAAGTAIVTAAALGTWLGSGLGADTTAVAIYAGSYGCAAGLAVLISTAWGRYTAGRCLLALRGLLPFRLMGFIEDAHERGVFRKPGAFYQFRHARLQARLRGDGPALLEDRPYEVLKADVPWYRVVWAQVKGPVRKIVVNLLVVITIAAWFPSFTSRELMEYRSGTRPEHYMKGVTAGPTSTAVEVPVWRWKLAPGTGSVTSTYTVPPHRFEWPYQEFGGYFSVEKCGDASVEVRVTMNGRLAPQVYVISGSRSTWPTDYYFPDDLVTVSFTFRRLDSARCTALVDWLSPSLNADPLHTIRRHFS